MFGPLRWRKESLVLAPSAIKKVRQTLSADALYQRVRSSFEELPDHRHEKAAIPLSDALSSAFAMFSLKDPSLLAFDRRRNDQNMKTLFGIGQIPSDTRMREILDGLQPDLLRPAFNDVFRQLQRGKVLESYVFHEDCYLLALDGTGYFSSNKIHCDCCLEKKNKQTGEVTYQHQLLGAVIVHPDHKEVIPLAPEPIQKQDGDSKNDCERNAAKRLLRKIRQEHPRLKLLVIEDGLASNAPHIRDLQELRMHFLLGVKPGDHAFLFDRVVEAFEEDRLTVFSWQKGDVTCEIAFTHDLPLNESHQDLRVNFLQYAEYGPDGHRQKYFTWVTDLKITKHRAPTLVRGGRARWKIENETFNTLKNQGYQFEHNFGHGPQNLSVVFAMLMMLAFLVDQTQQRACPLFGAVLKKLKTKRALWDNLRSHFRHFTFTSMQHLYEVILHDLAKELPAPSLDTS
jgi:Transposase DDE domain